MPFSGPSSYLTTITEFEGHWTDVNAELTGGGGTDLVLAGGYELADLTSDKNALDAKMTELEGGINVMEGHRTSRYNQEPVVRERMKQLDNFVRGVLSHSEYVGQIQPLVAETANPGKWVKAMVDRLHMWTTINAAPPAGFTPPLELNGAFTLANFTTLVTALRATYDDLTNAEQDVDRFLDERDAIYQRIRAQLTHYRTAVEGLFPSEHPLITSTPRLAPLPGHTPDPVVLDGDWNAGTSMADLSWTASADPTLDYYHVRRSGADPYNGNLEQVVAIVPAGQLTFSTVAGLPGSGSKMQYKVYVVLTTGNERGSNAVEIVRP